MAYAIKQVTNRAARHMAAARIATALAFLAAIAAFFPHAHTNPYIYEQGQTWNYAKLVAPFDVPVHPDSAYIRRTTDSITAAFLPVYSLQPVDAAAIAAKVRARMAAYAKKDGGDTAGTDRFAGALGHLLANAYARGVLADSLPASLGTRHRAKARILQGNVLETVPVSGFVTTGTLLQQADSLAAAMGCRRALQNAGLQVLAIPSVVCDEQQSNRILANQISLVSIDRGVIQRGQTIIDKGAVITPQNYTNLRTYEAMASTFAGDTNRSAPLMLLGQVLYIAVLLTLLMGYLYIYERRTLWDNYRSVLLVLCMVAAAFFAAVILQQNITAGIYLVPLTVVTILTMVFFGGRVALMTTITTVMLCAGITGFALEFIFMQFAAGICAVYSLRDLVKRQQLLRTSLFVLGAYWTAYMAVQLMMNGSMDDFSWRTVLYLTVNATLTSLAYVLMFPLERVFGCVSKVTLVEMTDANTPLLRRLSDECPGTFQHSVAVGTLAADAARAIGADEIVTRAGAMYHDIGKMGNPLFFTENQHGVNPHDGLQPARSAEIITGHVAEGVRRAEKAGLPGVITQFIREHHGRGLAKYFYVTACNDAPDGRAVDPAPFTYPGPDPQSRETSLLMMADAIEAASRSLAEHTADAHRDLVDRIIDGQLKEGRHNSSPLSLRDIPLIKQAFVKRLGTMYHIRIAYPDARKNG